MDVTLRAEGSVVVAAIEFAIPDGKFSIQTLK